MKRCALPQKIVSGDLVETLALQIVLYIANLLSCNEKTRVQDGPKIVLHGWSELFLKHGVVRICS